VGVELPVVVAVGVERRLVPSHGIREGVVDSPWGR
jgi:hypothetical protein